MQSTNNIMTELRLKQFNRINGESLPPAKTYKDVVINQMTFRTANQFPYEYVQDYKGFELWKCESGTKGDFCVRYTGYGKPVVNTNGNPKLVGWQLEKMFFYRINLTSAKAMKEFITNCFTGN